MGQHVNTTSSRVTLRWNVRETSLAERHKERLLEKLGSRLTSQGELVINSDATRSQLRNREDARARLRATVLSALTVQKSRRPTRPSRSSQRKRIAAKKRRGDHKRLRGRVRDE